MKVTRNPVVPAFEPVTIVLETEEEVAALWHLTNCHSEQCLARYENDLAVERGAPVLLVGQKLKLWTLLDRLWRPR